MLGQNQIVQFSDHDLEVIKDALFTQEKILAVQSRAGGNAAKTRLNELKELLSRMRVHDTQPKAIAKTTEPHHGVWHQVTRILSD